MLLKRVVIFCLIMAVTLLAGPGAPTGALAGVTIGGALRLETSYLAQDSDASGTGSSLVDLDIFHMGTTNLNFTWASADKKYQAYVEIGLLSSSLGNSVYMRRSWFSYNWDGGSILFGQTASLEESYFPASILRGTGGILGFGKDWWDRPEQIRLTLGKRHRLKLAIERPTHTADFDTNGDGATDGFSTHVLPAVAAALDLSFGNVNIYPWFRWELETVRVAADGRDVYWNSLDLGLELAGNFGLIGFTTGVSYGLNSTGTNPVAGPARPVFDATFNDRADHVQFRFFADLRIESLHIGGGYATASMGDLNGVSQWAGSPSTASLYVNYWISAGPMIFVPEIAWYKFGESTAGVDQGNGLRVGIYYNLNF